MLQSPFTRKGNFPSSRPLPRKEGKKTYVKEKKLYNLTELVTSVLTKHHLCCVRIPPELTPVLPHSPGILHASTDTNDFLRLVTKEIKGFELPRQTYTPSQPAGERTGSAHFGPGQQGPQLESKGYKGNRQEELQDSSLAPDPEKHSFIPTAQDRVLQGPSPRAAQRHLR